MGPSASGTYSATNATVLTHIESYLVKYFTTKGFTRVTASCVDTNPTTAACTVAGTNSSGSRSTAELTIAVNQTTGALRITRAEAINPGTGMTSTGPAGTMGPPASGTYSAINHTVLQHIANTLGRFFVSKGFSNVHVRCVGMSPAIASCRVGGTDGSGRRSSAIVTIAVNRTTGALRITHVS